MKQIEMIKNFVNGWNNSMYSLNTEGAKYYGATFYKRNAWDGSFEWQKEDVEKYIWVCDLRNGEIRKSGKLVGNLKENRQ